jgi:putative YphP/YqiW family bacilliredoxin
MIGKGFVLNADLYAELCRSEKYALRNNVSKRCDGCSDIKKNVYNKNGDDMFNNSSNTRQPMYDVDAVQPMRDELIAVGFTELLTAAAVEAAVKVKDDKTVLVVINSVCGCAAGGARPGVSLALQNKIIPDKLYTVFAGQDKEAVERVREYIKDFPPSSPSIALFKNGELIHFTQRSYIEGFSPEQIASDLIEAFEKFCSGSGPSIDPEDFKKVLSAKACGSKIPSFKNN